jgi:hypothetical protein
MCNSLKKKYLLFHEVVDYYWIILRTITQQEGIRLMSVFLEQPKYI